MTAKNTLKKPGKPAAKTKGWIGELAGQRNKQDTAPASYHHGNLRAALIDAGLQALEEQDHEDISLRELARRVGVSANATYRHFANKEALLAAMAAEGFHRLDAAETAAAAKISRADAGFRAAGLAYVQFAIDNPALFRLMFGRFTCTQRDPELVASSMGGFQSLLSTVAGLGKLEPDDPRALLHALLAWSIVHGLSHLALGGQLDYFGGDVRKLASAVIGLIEVPAAA